MPPDTPWPRIQVHGQMALGNAFVFGAQPDDVAEGVYEWLGYAWEGLSGSERQAIIICFCAVLFFYFIVRRVRGWGSPKEEAEDKEADEHLRLFEAVQARACENEVLHGKLLNQVYKGKLLKREMRWLRECLRATQEGLQKLRNEHEELRAALSDSGVDEKTSGPEGDGDSRPTSRRTSRPNTPTMLTTTTVTTVPSVSPSPTQPSPTTTPTSSPPPSPRHVCPLCPKHGMRPAASSSPAQSSHHSSNVVVQIPRPLRILVASQENTLPQKKNQSLEDATSEALTIVKEPSPSLIETQEATSILTTPSTSSSNPPCPARKPRLGPEMPMTTRLRPLIDSEKRRFYN